MADTQQTLWEAIRKTPDAITTAGVAAAAGASEVYTRRYLAALYQGNYLRLLEGPGPRYALDRDSGPAAPRLRKHGQEIVGLWDPNLCPPMDPAELRAIRARSGLSLAAFAEALGWARSSAIHVRRMEQGSKPISPDVAAKARAMTTAAGEASGDRSPNESAG